MGGVTGFDYEVVRWWEEIDKSAKLARPMFQQALARCESGETAGISWPGSTASPLQ